MKARLRAPFGASREVVKINAFLTGLDATMSSGLVTREKVQVMQFGSNGSVGA